MECRSCPGIAEMQFVVNAGIDRGGSFVTLCCEGMPGVELYEEPANTFGQLFWLRTQLIAQSVTGKMDGRMERFCSKCKQYRTKDWTFDPLISFVNLSVYPSPCQCNCVYCLIRDCGMIGDKALLDTPAVRRAYELLFTNIRFGQDHGFISPNAGYQVSCGEITIHNYKRRIMELAKGRRTTYFTNCFLYDEDIAAEMHQNPQAKINLSIDAGTPETWHRVKRANNFERVTDNLVRYYKQASARGQITLKYIVLPDVNDTYEDFSSLMEIMKVLEVDSLTIARDGSKANTPDAEYRKKLLGGAAYLAAMCKSSGFQFELSLFSEQEELEILKGIVELMQKE